MHKLNNYVVHTPMTANQVLEKAAEIVANRYLRGDVFTNPQATKDFLQYKMAGYEREVFAVLLLDNQHRLIEYKELFFGTIDAASVYPREVVKVAFNCNAAAVIFAHNHPSGIAEPSNADKQITQKLRDALALIDIRVLDHFVVGETCISFAKREYL
ncbi:RadC family protein [Photobacterium phosphoreum]|uniref:RadC family protein n=1 Tax=Photobacterium phosphoreum TaxID=659 RepID=UPI001E28957E|nr:DNA repair protein RadC [Photobacterium phosphoreum]MCD9519222.1 DNA repair protein RadC [Photobacterium phosphoreum]